MKIIKIGGAVLKDANGFSGLAELLAGEQEQTIAVVSALEKTTRNLAEAGIQALAGNLNSAFDISQKIFDCHSKIVAELAENEIENAAEQISEIFNQINDILNGVAITGELTKRTNDILLSFGEDLALALVHWYLNFMHIPIDILNAKTYLITDAAFGNAKPDMNLTGEKLLEALSSQSNKLHLTQGFVGATIGNEITTMGMESSNLTAAVLASITNSKELIILTDVDGIYTIDPKLCPNAKTLKTMSIETAKLLAGFGLKLIYPGMISLMESNGFSLLYRSLNDTYSTYLTENTSNTDLPIIVFGKTNMISRDNGFTRLKSFLDSDSDDSFIAVANVDFAKNLEINTLAASLGLPPKISIYQKEIQTAVLVFESNTNIAETALAVHKLLVE